MIETHKFLLKKCHSPKSKNETYIWYITTYWFRILIEFTNILFLPLLMLCTYTKILLLEDYPLLKLVLKKEQKKRLAI